MTEPLISVILPTWNRAALVREAIESVLAQTFPDWELIVVDDGSADASLEYLRSLTDARVQVIAREHCGNPATLRNAALDRARGTYVAFLDSDDRWDADKLATQLAALRSDPAARWSYTRVRWMDENGAAVPPPTTATWTPCSGWILHDLLAWKAWVALPSVMAERALVDEAGRFDERYVFNQDFELWVRLARRSPVVLVETPLVSVRLHRGNTWRSASTHALELFLAVYDGVLASPVGGDARRIARRMRARAAILLSNRYRADRNLAAASRALLRAMPYGTLRPSWWVALAKTAARVVL